MRQRAQITGWHLLRAQTTGCHVLIWFWVVATLLFIILGRASPFMWFELGISALAVILFTAYQIARGMKGKVEIEIAKNSYTSGEEIAGEVTITICRNIHINRFCVAFIGEEILIGAGSEGENVVNQIYRREHNLAEACLLTAGTNHSLEFTFVVPGSNSPRNQEDQIPATDNAAVVGLSNAKRRLNWTLIAEADLFGIDLSSDRRTIGVNLI